MLWCASDIEQTGRGDEQSSRYYQPVNHSLVENEREALIEMLSESLHREPAALSEEWTAEISSRIAESESGSVQTIP